MMRILLAAALAAATHAQGPDPVPAPAAAELAFARDQSSWQMHARHGAGDERDRGVYPIGNGRVFTHLGLGPRANTMRDVSGPTYGTTGADGGAPFGELTLDVTVGGTAEPLDRQAVGRVRGAGFVVTEDRGPRIALRTLTFAPPDATALVRVVEVRNVGDAPLDEVACRLRFTGGTVAGFSAAARMTGAPADGSDHATAIGALAPGGHWLGALRVTIGAAGPVPAAPTLAEATAAATRTLEWWRDRLADTTTYDTDHVKVRDLIEDWKVTVLALRCAETGVVVPMLDRRVATVRDTAGAMLAFLRFRLWDEARDLLRFWHAAVRAAGRVRDEAPLVAADPAAELDWGRLAVDSHDAANLLVLLHHWYWRATRDTATIHDHWLLLDSCWKRQRRRDEVLLPYRGDDLQRLGLDRLGPSSGLIGHDPARDRTAYSLAAATQFLVATQALGELLDGRDRDLHPEKYAGEAADVQKPSRGYVKKMFTLMQGIERHFWLEEEGMFAPALSPIGLRPHRGVVAHENLTPLWIGWTYPTGEKSRDNLRNSMHRVWKRGARIGTTATVGHVAGEVQGMLLTALAERDAAERLDCLDALLEMAAPAGEWAAAYGPDGRPLTVPGARRLSPFASGVDLDALVFALTGVRHVAVANWDSNDIRLEFRLPHGASYFAVRGTEKDGRALNLFFREEESMLTDEERRANDQLAEDKRRDPTVAHRRTHLVVDLVRGEPAQGYYDVALNAQGTVFVRYLWHDAPRVIEPNPEQPDAAPQTHDPRKIVESEFAEDDHLVFLAAERAAGRPSVDPAALPAGELLCLTARASTADALGEGAAVFDTGLPFDPAALEAALFADDGSPSRRRVYLDWGHDGAPPLTFTPPATWQHAAALLARFRTAGGEVLDPGFGHAGRIDDALERRTLRLVTELAADTEAVLRTGGDGALAIRVDGAPLATTTAGRAAVPDLDAFVVKLGAGVHEIELAVEGRRPAVFVRLSDPRGLPLPGVSWR